MPRLARLLPALTLCALATVAQAQEAVPATTAPVQDTTLPAAEGAVPGAQPDTPQQAVPATSTPEPAAALPADVPTSRVANAPPAQGDVVPAAREAGPAPEAPAPAAATTPPTPADASSAPSVPDAPTQAEQDYNAIYGNQGYDPVADPTLPPPAQLPTSFDPWEKWNRRTHRFNNVVDRRVAKPLAKAYVAAVPRPMRLGVRNFFNNLSQPLSAINALLQGEPRRAAQALGRFALNSTLGIGGVFDPASDAHLPNHGEDFGQTLGVWGWKRSRYLELPLFGPRTVRDVFGMAGDAPLSPMRQIDNDPTRIFLQGLQLVDIRTQLFAVDSMREGATDDYSLVRDAWLQRRNYQIFGDRQQHDAALPDYLQDDNANPLVPVDAIPVPQPE
jgi:phospholipid-binding lipoprotein MlaA